MAKRPAAKRDFMQVARGIVEQAIGEQINGRPLPLSEERDPRALNGRAGGLKGGPARAHSLSATRRKKIAQNAAKARWAKKTR
jgi:hypothetical protein